jgi:hypothetical protein
MEGNTMTTKNYCETLVEAYLGELGSGFAIYPQADDGGCIIVTPFIRPDGEAIEVALSQYSSGQLVLSDMGGTFGYLFVNGLTINRGLIDNARSLTRRFNITLHQQELVVQPTNSELLGSSLHSLIQGVLQVSDLIQKRRPANRLRFDDEVEKLIITHGAIYDSDYEVQGRREKYRIRFHINSGRRLLVQPISAASEAGAFQWAERWAWRFTEVKRQDPSWRFVTPLDDRGSRRSHWSPRVLSPLTDTAEVVFWSENQKFADLLHSQ